MVVGAAICRPPKTVNLKIDVRHFDDAAGTRLSIFSSFKMYINTRQYSDAIKASKHDLHVRPAYGTMICARLNLDVDSCFEHVPLRSNSFKNSPGNRNFGLTTAS